MCTQAIIKIRIWKILVSPFLQAYPFNKNKSKSNVCAQRHRIHSNNFRDSVLIDKRDIFQCGRNDILRHLHSTWVLQLILACVRQAKNNSCYSMPGYYRCSNNQLAELQSAEAISTLITLVAFFNFPGCQSNECMSGKERRPEREKINL